MQIECAYCHKNITPTKEHVFPNFFYKTLNLKDTNSSYISFNAGTNKVIKKELFVTDVCDRCNNIELSKLDNYFSKIAQQLLFLEDTNTPWIEYTSTTADSSKPSIWSI